MLPQCTFCAWLDFTMCALLVARFSTWIGEPDALNSWCVIHLLMGVGSVESVDDTITLSIPINLAEVTRDTPPSDPESWKRCWPDTWEIISNHILEFTNPRYKSLTPLGLDDTCISKDKTSSQQVNCSHLGQNQQSDWSKYSRNKVKEILFWLPTTPFWKPLWQTPSLYLIQFYRMCLMAPLLTSSHSGLTSTSAVTTLRHCPLLMTSIESSPRRSMKSTICSPTRQGN